MANDKQLHPKLIDFAQLENIAPGAFYFVSSTYPPVLLMPPAGVEINIPTAHTAVEQIPSILEKYPAAVCLFIFEEIYRRHNVDLEEKQITALRSVYLNILHHHSNKPHIRELTYSSKLMRSEDKSFVPEFKADLALNLKLGFKAENTITLQDILADLTTHPKNADFYFNAESFFRGYFLNNAQVIEQLIQLNKPEVHRAIRKHKLIDTIKYRWRKRNELYAALEEAEKLAPAEFVLHRYFDALDAPQAGYYARRRLAKYKAEAEQLPVEFKVEFILKNPSRAVDFFYDEQFIYELTHRRPDLFFELLNLKELVISERFKSHLFVSPHGFTGKLVEAVVRVGTSEQINYLERQLDGLGWTVERYPRLRDKIKKAKDNAKKAGKEKEEASSAVALRSHLTTVKIELSDITQLDRVLKENQNCKKLEVYTPIAIFVVDFSQQQKKLSDKHAGITTPILIYRADLEIPLYLPAEYSIGICSVSTTYVSSDEFQQAYRAKVSPVEMNFKPVQRGAFARLGQWLSKLLSRAKQSPIAGNIIKKAPIQITGKSVPSSATKMKPIFSSSELSTSEKSGDTESANSEDDVIASNASDPEELYLEARGAFVEGNYSVAIQKIRDCTYSILKRRKSSEDERSCVVNHLMDILHKTKADLFDYLMVDELMQQEMPDLGPLVSLRTAVVQVFGEFTLSKSNFSSMPDQWRGPFQLFVLEREFLNVKNPNTIDYKREAVRLQQEYMAVLKEHQEIPLARAIAAKSHLVSYHPASTEIAKSRVTVMNMFERDPKRLIEQMFDVLAREEIADHSQFISSVIAKVGLDHLTSYVREIYPRGLKILLQNSPYFRSLLFATQLKVMGIIRNTTPQFRQILREYLPSEFERAKRALHEEFTLDVQKVVDGTSSAEKMFSDPFFIDELEANPKQRELIFERDDLYAVYGKYGTKYHDVALLFQQYARNENPPEDSLTKVIAQAGMRQVLNCIIGNCPYGLRILLEKYPAAHEILNSKESYLQALASSDFPEVRHTLRQCGFELSAKVKEILARKMRKNVEALTDEKIPDPEKAREKLNDKFFVAELFVPENVEELREFEAKFPGLLQKVVSARMYSLAESIAQAQVRASSIPKPF